MKECPKCKCFAIETKSSYKYFDIYECKICGYWTFYKIEECCRNPILIVTIDRKSYDLFFLYKQCVNCGGSINRTKPLITKKYNNEIRCAFDTLRFECWKNEIKNEQHILSESKRNFDFINSPKYKYYLYLTSNDWKDKRDLVLKRDKNVCQKCLMQPAEEVHHLTYENLGNEDLIDLISVCKNCHIEIHSENNK